MRNKRIVFQAHAAENKKVRKWVLLGLSSLVLTACTSSVPRGEGSVLIIAIPGFRADDLNCGVSSDSLTPKLDTVCNESVRFTHAYTPAVLSNPALASLLTGLYPVEHGVRRNNGGFYLDGVESLAQAASDVGLETIFMSGGPPFLRKSAISKGFNDFDDSIRQGGRLFIPPGEVVRKFLNVLDTRAEGVRFFGVLTFVGLTFPQAALQNLPQNENREAADSGKLQEIDEAIGVLRQNFLDWKIWDQLTVVIVGLHGKETREHAGLPAGLNLYDEVAHIPLLVKPSRRPRDQGTSWKIDNPISLVDLGVTLQNMLKTKLPKQSQFPVADFSSALNGKDLTIPERPLFCESDLPVWRGWGPRKLSMRLGEWLYMPGVSPQLFNTYTDRLELHELYSIDQVAAASVHKVWQKYNELLDKPLAEGPDFLPVSIGQKIKAAQTIFSKNTFPDEKSRAMAELLVRRSDDWQAKQWQAELFLESQDWMGLHQMVSRLKPVTKEEKEDYKYWRTLARIQLKLKLENIGMGSYPDCLALNMLVKRDTFTDGDLVSARAFCKDPETQYWIRAYMNFQLKRLKEAIPLFESARVLTDKRKDQNEFAKAFWIAGAVWDFSPSLPSGPGIFDMFLALVNGSDFSEFVKKKSLP